MTANKSDTLADLVGQNLPFLRRYARALTGSQPSGDAYAAATLEAILTNPDGFDTSAAKLSLFSVFHSIWSSTGHVLSDNESGLAAKAQAHLGSLTANSREALLLHTVEEFSIDQIAQIMGEAPDDARGLIDVAYLEMSKSVSGKIMVIEDEAIIANDLSEIIAEMGHQTTGIARTEEKAMEMFADDRPDLILSDIQLADNSSGIDAVNRILVDAPDIPVIFITAFPERLLTGQGPEPAFLISKPYEEDQVRSAISQAMFFSSTETLKA